MVNDRQTLFDSLRRNQMYCPKMKECIMTCRFMQGCIGYKLYWLPKCVDIKFLNCVDPPSRIELARLVVACMKKQFNPAGDNQPFDSSFKRTAEEILKKPPSQDWLLAMLATMDPMAQVFRKDYVKPKVVSRFAQPDDLDADMVENVEGFFDGLPIAGRSSKQSATVRFGGDSEAMERQKLRKMQMQSEIMSQRLQK